jgi:hypothetical protein
MLETKRDRGKDATLEQNYPVSTSKSPDQINSVRDAYTAGRESVQTGGGGLLNSFSLYLQIISYPAPEKSQNRALTLGSQIAKFVTGPNAAFLETPLGRFRITRPASGTGGIF